MEPTASSTPRRHSTRASPNMTITFSEPKGATPRHVADATLVFDNPAELLHGLRLVGFAVWAHLGGRGYTVRTPS